MYKNHCFCEKSESFVRHHVGQALSSFVPEKERKGDFTAPL